MPRRERAARRLQRAIFKRSHRALPSNFPQGVETARCSRSDSEWIPVPPHLPNEAPVRIRPSTTEDTNTEIKNDNNRTTLNLTLLDLQEQFNESRRYYAAAAAADAVRLLDKASTPMDATHAFHPALWHHVRAHENRNRARS